MWDIKDEIWNKQIGNKEIGKDFSGREIHYEDFEDFNSPYGWTLITLNDDEYLVAHILSKSEFPTDILENLDKEFIINNKIFNIEKNKYGASDINSIEYDEKFIPNSNSNENISEDYTHKEETRSFSFNNYNDEEEFDENYEIQKNKYDFDNSTLENQEKQIQELQKKLLYEQTHQIKLAEMQKQSNMKKQEQIEKNKIKMKELKDELLRTQSFNSTLASELDNFNFSNFNSNDGSFNSSFMEAQMNSSNYSNQGQTRIFGFNNSLNNNSLLNSNNNSTIKSSTNKSILENLSKKIDEQTMQINSLKMNQKNNELRLKEREEKSKNKIELENSLEYQQAIKIWEINFGNDKFASDFAGKIISKDKYNSDEEGGWKIDYYDINEKNSSFIAASSTIKERSGRNDFYIDGINYCFTKIGNSWQVNKSKKGQSFKFSSKNMKDIASSIKPDDNLSKTYESYSSLLINLNHFPLIHLNKFEEFVKKSLGNLHVYKEFFIYSNEDLYKNNESNISSYARVFFKTNSIKNDIEILLASLSFKKAMMDFINNFQQTNKHDEISFSLVLYSHQRQLKFIHAQTNFELLRNYPLPLKIPFERLIIDKTYNSILKFHENDLWRQLKPFALDDFGHTYYVCDLDSDNIDINLN